MKRTPVKGGVKLSAENYGEALTLLKVMAGNPPSPEAAVQLASKTAEIKKDIK